MIDDFWLMSRCTDALLHQTSSVGDCIDTPALLALATALIALEAAVGVTTSSNRLMVTMLSLPRRPRGDAS